MDLNALNVNSEKEIEGVVVHPWGDDTWLRVARIGNPRYEEELQRVVKPYRNLIRRNMLPPEKNQELLIEVYAKTILLGWGELDNGGEPLEYNFDNCCAALAKNEFFRVVNDIGEDHQLYQDEDVVESGKF